MLASQATSLTDRDSRTMPSLTRVERAHTATSGTLDVPPFEHKSYQQPLDVDGYSLPPEELELKQVHVFVRHGE